MSSDVLTTMSEDAIVYIRHRAPSSWGSYVLQFRGFADAKFPPVLPSLHVSLLQVKKLCWVTWLACLGSKALTAGVLAPNSRDTQGIQMLNWVPNLNL